MILSFLKSLNDALSFLANNVYFVRCFFIFALLFYVINIIVLIVDMRYK